MAVSGVLVTGANGFVGRALCRALTQNAHDVTALVRRSGTTEGPVREWCHAQADFEGLAKVWPADFEPTSVVHLAARVHVMNDRTPDPYQAFRATNVDGALRVARAAFENGARRFVFVSSIKAVAEADDGTPLTELACPQPADPYGRSKYEAEQALRSFGDESGMDIVIVRPPLVYGPGVGANFRQMLNVLWRGLPLPLGAIEARRSLIFSDNLADVLLRCAFDQHAANECFHVADNDALSVAQLLRKLGDELGRPARLLSVPPGLIEVAGKLFGRTDQVARLTQGLEVDVSRVRERLGWSAPFSIDDGLRTTAHWYRSLNGR